MSCYLVHILQSYPAKPCEQERCPWEAPPPSVSSSVKQTNTGLGNFKESESAGGNTQDSIWILGTGHQSMTWFAPGTGACVPSDVE